MALKYHYITTIFSLIVLYSVDASSDDSEKYALLAVKLWNSFECSALADVLNNNEEQERLFIYGYENGKEFLHALRSNKIKKEDLDSIAPSGVVFSLQGPSEDFILGRIYESSIEHALKNVFTTDGNYNPEKLRKAKAEDFFRKRNCNILGK